MNGRLKDFILKFGIFSAGGFYVTTSFSKGGAQTFGAAVIFCAIILFITDKWHKRVNPKDPLIVFLVLYLVWSFVSCLLGTDINRSLTVFRDEWVIALIPALAIILKTRSNIENMLKLLAISVIVVSIYGIIQHFWGYDLYRGEELLAVEESFGYRSIGLFANSVAFGNYMIIVSAFMFPLINTAGGKVNQLIFGAASLLSATAALLTYQRGPALLFIAIIITFMFRYSKKYLRPLIGTLILILIAIGLIAPGVYQNQLSHLEMELSGDNPRSRFVIWQGAAEIIADNPVFGVGPGNFAENFLPYVHPVYPYYHAQAHNDYLNIAVHTGIPSLVIFFGIYWAVYKRTRRLRKIGDDYSVAIADTVIFGTLTFILAGLYEAVSDNMVLRLLLYSCWGILLATLKVMDNETHVTT